MYVFIYIIIFIILAEGDSNTTDKKPESETLDDVKVDENEKDSTSDGSSESTGETKTEL